MKKYYPTIGRERERLSGSLATVERNDVIAEARSLGLDDSVVYKIGDIFTPGFEDDPELLSDEEWGVPISSVGRLRYDLQLVLCRLRANLLGNVKKNGHTQRDDYKGKNIEISEGNVYLLEETFLPIALDEVVLDLSQNGKGLKQDKSDRLVLKANMVINSLLQNPYSRSRLAAYEEVTAADLFLVFDSKTYNLHPRLDGFNLSGQLDEILKGAEKGTIHLVKEKFVY